LNGQLNVNDGVIFANYGITCSPYALKVGDDTQVALGTSVDCAFIYETADANAKMLIGYVDESTDAGNNVPVFAWTEHTGAAADLGLFDGVTQPIVTSIEKGNQLHSATDGIADAGAASAILKHVGGFTNAVVGDIVRITAGTLCTAGWYWITTVTSADQVTLDRNYTSGNTTNVAFVTYHDFTMLSADGICTRITDGAPTDSSVEIDRDGWIIMDVGNNLLYGRSQSTWQHWTPDGGAPNFANLNIESTGVLAGVGTGANGMILKNPKNAAASALSGTQLDVEIDIGGTPYHFTVYPTKA